MLSYHTRLPHLPGVGVVLINDAGLVWMGQRLPECAKVEPAGGWEMPQVGVGPGETVRDAALVAIEEKAGIRSVQVLAEAPGWFTCELPTELIGVALNGQYCGQKQKWLALRFLGDDSEIELTPRAGRGGEFASWRWVPAEEVPQLAAPLMRELYEDVIATFAPFIAGFRGNAPTLAHVPSRVGEKMPRKGA